jgi:hypothetical protein
VSPEYKLRQSRSVLPSALKSPAERNTKIVTRGFANNNHIGGGGSGGDTPIIVEEIGAAGVGGILHMLLRPSRFLPSALKVASSKSSAKIITAGFASNDDIGRGSRGRDTPVVVEEIDAAGRIKPWLQRPNLFAIGVPVAHSKGE